jgi:hypothetical protein
MGGSGMSSRDWIDASAFDHAAAALERAGFERTAGSVAVKTLRKGANVVRKNVRAAVRRHRKTGRLSAGVRTKFTGAGMDFSARITSTGPIAHLIAGGVRPHEIGPPPYGRGSSSVMAIRASGAGRSGPVNKLIKVSDAIGYATVVHNPGFAADPYFHKGVQNSLPEINALAKAGAEAMATELKDRMGKR